MEQCGPCPVFASVTLAFALQLREKARKNLSQGSRRVLHSVTYTRYRIDAIKSPDDEHLNARNM